MTMLLYSHEQLLDHLTGAGHPERPERLGAVTDGLREAGVFDALTPVAATAAPLEAILNVHTEDMTSATRSTVARAGDHQARIDADTVVSMSSWDAARLAAGAGLQAIEALDRGEADAAFCAVRPPGHHATAAQAMGFCLLNNVAVAATHLADRGERVLIVDYDVHHGNGTQDIFYADPRVMFISFHQYPAYPGTGAPGETGAGDAVGLTMNFALPSGATGDVYRRGWDDVARPAIEAFDPTWVLLSAGFDAHRADPLSDMGLSAGDYADLTRDVLSVSAPGRRIAFLEGGYDLGALGRSAAACIGAFIDTQVRPEASTAGGPGGTALAATQAARAIT